MQRYTVKQFMDRFPDDDTCLDWLRHRLYPERIFCPVCDTPRKHHRIRGRKVYGCDYCGHQISPTANTIFHKSRTSLRSWFYAIFLMSSTRCGISAKQLERELGVTYKTAWRMFTQIRARLMDGQFRLTGDVEIDETYVGGKRRNVPKGRPGRDSHKTPVLGMVQRKGRVIARVATNLERRTIMPVITEHVLPTKGTHVFTDEYRIYNPLIDAGYRHSRINHASKVYVMGNVHTNTIEGFWSLVKRGIGGVYHAVSRKYLQGYLDEYAFRYNHRDDETPMFETMLATATRRI